MRLPDSPFLKERIIKWPSDCPYLKENNLFLGKRRIGWPPNPT
jgi:hypothetical protein